MSAKPNPARLKAAAIYNLAADHFDAPPLGFWERHSRTAVELAGLLSGDRVLDVGCGTGASALPAAKAVGPDGTVVGIDVAETMLRRARHKAATLGIGNASFRLADMTGPGQPDLHFDAVISVFSVFFTPDMESQIATLWRMVRPGGRLVVTVWGERALEPGASVFGSELCRVCPHVAPLARPWERLTDPDNLRRLIAENTGVEPEVLSVADHQPLADPMDWWTIVLGSGFRWEADRLFPEDQLRLRTRVLQRIAEDGIDAVETNAVHAVARRAD